MSTDTRAKPGALRRAFDQLDRLPERARNRGFGMLFTRAVKYAGTTGIRFEHVDPRRVVVSLANRRKAQNHIGGLHAVAMAMIAESATGAVLGLNLPAGKIPVIKHMGIDYTRRAEGGMRAEARLSDQQVERLNREERGEITVPVTVTDSSGAQPIVCSMVWAWVPARR